MKLKLFDIPGEGLDLAAKSDSDPWFAKVVKEAFPEDYPEGHAASLALHLLMTCDNVTMIGKAEVELKPACDRCLETFSHHLSVPVNLVLAPAKEVEAKLGEEVEITEEDLNFSFYRGDSVNLSDIVREFLVLATPLRFLCRNDCKGICPICGQDLNKADCSCKLIPADPRLAPLKKIRLKS